MIQNNMNWWEHVTKIVKKAGKRLYMLRLLKRANKSVINRIYYCYKARFGICLPSLAL